MVGSASRSRPSLTKCFSLPRLETRTKESNMPASTGVAETPVRSESERRWQGGSLSWVSGPHHRPTAAPRGRGLSVSVYVGTRKMVNYA